MFLYSDTGTFAKAYFITPSTSGYMIYHQYDCMSVSQFETMGVVEEVPEPYATKVASLLSSCDVPSRDVMEMNTGWEVDEVLGEGLMRLKDGRYVATSNCD